MKLKFKPLDLESGRPIAFVNEKFASKHNIHEGKRMNIRFKKTNLILPVNIVEKLLRDNQISFSDEALEVLKLKSGAEVKVSPALDPRSARYILKKLNKHELTKKEIHTIIDEIVNNSLTEAEIAYFVSAVHHNGMSFKETVYLTEAIAKTGKTLQWKSKKIADKHSIGGIPNNRTTPLVISICAAAGIIMPKTSSRAITSAAGTADAMETITNIDLDTKKLQQVVQKTNACLAWGGSLGLAPADDKLIRVERLLNLDPEPQLIASILAKKLSVGSKHVLIDIPYGDGAKVSLKKGKHLKQKFEKIGKKLGMNIQVVLTKGDRPIGNGIGPLLEIMDVLKVLNRKDSPKDLEEKAIFLSALILEMMGKAKKGKGKKLAQEILDSKKALKKFNEIISAQGKKKKKVQLSKIQHKIKSKKNTKIKSINNKKINFLAKILGCPTCKGCGIYLHKNVSSTLKKGEAILILYAESKAKLSEALKYCEEEKPITFVA